MSPHPIRQVKKAYKAFRHLAHILFCLPSKAHQQQTDGATSVRQSREPVRVTASKEALEAVSDSSSSVSTIQFSSDSEESKSSGGSAWRPLPTFTGPGRVATIGRPALLNRPRRIDPAVRRKMIWSLPGTTIAKDVDIGPDDFDFSESSKWGLGEYEATMSVRRSSST